MRLLPVIAFALSLLTSCGQRSSYAFGGFSTTQPPPPSAAAVAIAANTALTSACRRRRSTTPIDAVRQTHVELGLFQPSPKFAGAFLGFIFTSGSLGVGYYRDELSDAFIKLPLADLLPSDSLAASVSRSWGCVDAGTSEP